MRRFLASAWFPFLAALLLAGGCTAAFVLLKPVVADGNSDVVRAAMIAGWSAGPVAGLLAWILMLILNGVRRLLRVRRFGILHPVVVLLGLAPSIALAIDLVFVEPRYTPLVSIAMDFVGRPLLWGDLAAVIFVLLFWLLSLFFKPARK